MWVVKTRWPHVNQHVNRLLSNLFLNNLWASSASYFHEWMADELSGLPAEARCGPLAGFGVSKDPCRRNEERKVEPRRWQRVTGQLPGCQWREVGPSTIGNSPNLINTHNETGRQGCLLNALLYYSKQNTVLMLCSPIMGTFFQY